MFKRPHHRRIETLLRSLNSDVLREAQCFFGGGTAIVLLLDEYRESVDVDFLCLSQGRKCTWTKICLIVFPRFSTPRTVCRSAVKRRPNERHAHEKPATGYFMCGLFVRTRVYMSSMTSTKDVSLRQNGG